MKSSSRGVNRGAFFAARYALPGFSLDDDMDIIVDAEVANIGAAQGLLLMSWIVIIERCVDFRPAGKFDFLGDHAARFRN